MSIEATSENWETREAGPVEYRLYRPIIVVRGEVASSCAGKIWEKHGGSAGTAGAAAVAELMTLATSATSASTYLSQGSCCGCCCGSLGAEHYKLPLPSTCPSGANDLLELFDGNGDGALDPTEWTLLTELLGITAGTDELSYAVRRYQLEHLTTTALSRLTIVNPLELSAQRMLGRCVVVENFEQPMVVVKAPKEGALRKMFSSKEKSLDFELMPLAAQGGQRKAVPGVQLRFKGNKSGLPWKPAAPTPPSFFANESFGWKGAPPPNPLVDALRTKQLGGGPVARLGGDELAAGRACGACCAESLYRPWGFFPWGIALIPMFCPVLPLMGAPCVVCCVAPCAMAAAGRAKELTLTTSYLRVFSDAHSVPVRPYIFTALQDDQKYKLPRIDDVHPLCELGEVQVMKPLGHGLNGWSCSLVVRDKSGIVVASVDHRSRKLLETFAEQLRAAISAAASGDPSAHIEPDLLDGYRYHAAHSWMALERARHPWRTRGWRDTAPLRNPSHQPPHASAAPQPQSMYASPPLSNAECSYSQSYSQHSQQMQQVHVQPPPQQMQPQLQPMQVQVPPGVEAGMPFQISANGAPMMIQCPAGAAAGQMITIRVPTMPASAALSPSSLGPIEVQGVPVDAPTLMRGAPVGVGDAGPSNAALGNEMMARGGDAPPGHPGSEKEMTIIKEPMRRVGEML